MEIKENINLAPHTIYKIGGAARYFVEVKDAKELKEALVFSSENNLPFFVLGAGSNVLISDAGFNGAVIHPAGGSIAVQKNRITAEAGVAMARVVAEALKHGLSGFEWAVGIPGTIGGSVRGNAGCFGSEMSNVVAAIEVFNAKSGKIEEWPGTKAEFYYRDSVFKRRPELVVLAVTLELKPGNREDGEKLVRDYISHRDKTQDIGSRSAGCIFKNIPWKRRDIDAPELVSRFPELSAFSGSHGIPAGFLVDRVGLKGRSLGGAKISERHGNFIINTGGATAEDVLILIGIAKEHVHRTYGLLLEEEIQYIGFEE